MEKQKPPEARPIAEAGDLPEFAKKADDLEAIKKAVDDAAAVSGGIWLSYLFVLFYILATTGSVTDTDIFLENPLKLAIFTVNLGVSLLGFFFLSPIVFIVFHAYTLVYFVMLGDKSKWFNSVLHARSLTPHPTLLSTVQFGKACSANSRRISLYKCSRVLHSSAGGRSVEYCIQSLP